MPTHNFRLTKNETTCEAQQREFGVQVMSKAILSEAREIAVLMSMLLGLSALSLMVGCAAVMIADTQTRHIAPPISIASLEP